MENEKCKGAAALALDADATHRIVLDRLADMVGGVVQAMRTSRTGGV